jgi:hypothetical protein
MELKPAFSANPPNRRIQKSLSSPGGQAGPFPVGSETNPSELPGSINSCYCAEGPESGLWEITDVFVPSLPFPVVELWEEEAA